MSLSPALAEPPLFERILLPHRSLPPRGFHLMMLGLGLLSVAVGIGFISVGAWPVFGFFGLDVALLYLAFRLNYRAARQRETLRLTGDDFTVERVGIYGQRRVWRFQAFWLKVRLEEWPNESNRLSIGSHGRSLVIADFMPPAARRELAVTIRAALARWRQSPSAAAEPEAC